MYIVPKHHAVERSDEEGIEKFLVIHSHSHNSSDESEQLQMLIIAYPRVRIDLQCINIIGGILKQPIVGIEQFSGQVMEPVPGHPSIILASFAHEHNPKIVS